MEWKVGIFGQIRMIVYYTIRFKVINLAVTWNYKLTVAARGWAALPTDWSARVTSGKGSQPRASSSCIILLATL